MKNNDKGITLVALVITIIVLLILAGITIAALSGENGILKRAAQARYEEQIGQTKDLISMEVYDAATEFYYDKYVNGTDMGDNTIGDAIKNAITNGKYPSGKYPEANVAISGTSITITPQADSSKVATGTFNATTGAITSWVNPTAD